MIPYNYGLGFEPNGCPQIDLQACFEELKALIKKARRSASRRQQKR